MIPKTLAPEAFYAFVVGIVAIIAEVVLTVTGHSVPGDLSTLAYIAVGGALGISVPSKAVSTSGSSTAG